MNEQMHVRVLESYVASLKDELKAAMRDLHEAKEEYIASKMDVHPGRATYTDEDRRACKQAILLACRNRWVKMGDIVAEVGIDFPDYLIQQQIKELKTNSAYDRVFLFNGKRGRGSAYRYIRE